MFTLKKQIAAIGILAAMAFSATAQAHTTVLAKNTPDEYNSRNELEGTTGVNHFSLPHGCDGNPVEAQSIVFPNGENAVAVRKDNGEIIDNLSVHITGNAIMAPKPAKDETTFKKTETLSGPVPLFENHGESTEDTRAFKFTKANNLKADDLALIPWRATFPTFNSDSCAMALTVNIGIANYCTKSRDDAGRADIWIGRLTTLFDDPNVVSVDFWPFLRVVRDLQNNPIDESCGDGFEINVTPSDGSMDEFLPIAGFWPSDKSEEKDDENEHDDDDSDDEDSEDEEEDDNRRRGGRRDKD